MKLINLFKDKKKNNYDEVKEINEYIKENKERNIEDILKTSDNYMEVYQRIMEDRLNGTLPDDEFEQKKLLVAKYCKFSDLSNCNTVFVRVIKSSPEIANLSAEQLDYVETHEKRVTQTNSKIPLSSTTEPYIFTCLRYGDKIAYISYDEESIKSNNLSDEILYYRTNEFDEYVANKYYIKSIMDLKFPETLNHIVKVADEKVLINVIAYEPNSKNEILHYFNKFKLFETAESWKNVLTVFNLLQKNNINEMNSIKFIKKHIDEIIPKITLDEKINDYENTRSEKETNNKNKNIEEKLI